jgi:glycosyltransferase involved in cell wall biosynthesis
MRILHVHSGNLYGGVERMLAPFARTSRRAPSEHQFALCFEGRLAAELRAQGAAVEQLGEVRIREPWSIRRGRTQLRRVLERRTFDAVICHMPWAQAVFGPAVRKPGAPLVFWMHDVATGRHWLERAARRTVPDLALCNSYYTAHTLDALYPGIARQVIYPPIEIREKKITEEARWAIREALDTPRSVVVIMQASRMESWKGHETHLRALGLLREAPGWVCWIVGGAQRETEARHLRRLEALALKLGVAGRVKFCGERTEVRALMSAADIYCQPNLKPEPFGIVFGEAMAAGLPIVATRSGGVAELTGASSGWTLPANDAPALASALRALIEDSELRLRLGRSGAARIAALCDPQKQAGKLAAAIGSIMARGTTTAVGR